VPRCELCPVATGCLARAADLAPEIPPARPRPRRRRLVVACGVARRHGAVLLVKRPSRGLLGSLWDLPAVEVDAGGDARVALRAALRARFGVRVRVGKELAAVERTLTHRELTLRAFRCDLPVELARAAGARLVPLDALGELGISAATRALLAVAASPG
jgi:A/G-specific adenine glycosylase